MRLNFLETLGFNLKSLEISSADKTDFKLTLSAAGNGENDLTQMIRFLLDKFSVSNADYHETAQLVKDLN